MYLKLKQKKLLIVLKNQETNTQDTNTINLK